MKKTFLFLFINCCLLANSQEKVTDSDNKIRFAFSPGIIVQRNVFLDVNLLVGKSIIDLNPKVPIVGIQGIRIGLESDCNNIIAPKIGYEFNPMIFVLRLSAVNYFQKGDSEFRIIPELGLSFYSWMNLTYGYGISVGNNKISDIGHHRVSLTFNFNKRLGKKYLDKRFKQEELINSNTNAR
ncbi:MAG: hypothetical protein ABIQ27_12810 [Flavobacterium sp.]|uniref:hypothetical protein n=1 Tax=Flavobacterium sp. TaxID=239 RepID=UPI0032661FB3